MKVAQQGVSPQRRSTLLSYLWYVLGCNWLFAATTLPLACLLAWSLRQSAEAGIPLSVWCCVVSALLEFMASAAEHAWSRVGFLRLGAVSVPLLLLQALLCLLLARHEILRCLLISGILTCVREMLFEALFSSCSVGGRGAQERIASALLGGLVYTSALALLCSAALVLVRVLHLRAYAVSTGTIDLMLILILPVVRSLPRMFPLHVSAGGMGALRPQSADDESCASEVGGPSKGPMSDALVLKALVAPPLDAQFLKADVSFVLAMFLEVPIVFVIVLVPRVMTFCVALFANAVLDVLLVCLLDVLWRRRTRALVGCSRAQQLAQQLDCSPGFCLMRPVSVVATLLAGSLAPQDAAGECERLLPHQTTQGVSSDLALRVQHATTSQRAEGLGGGLQEVARRVGEVLSVKTPAEQGAAAIMSPRVTRLLDEYDEAWTEVKCSTRDAREADGAGQALLSFQDRKLTVTSYLLGNTVAAALVAACVALLRFHKHIFSDQELLLRLLLLFFLRSGADTICCWLLDLFSQDVPALGRLIVWKGRQELWQCWAWMSRIFAAAAALLVVVLATR